MNFVKHFFLSITLLTTISHVLIAQKIQHESINNLKKEIRNIHQEIKELQYDIFRSLKQCSCQNLGKASKDTSLKALKSHHAIATEILKNLKQTQEKVKNLCQLCIV